MKKYSSYFQLKIQFILFRNHILVNVKEYCTYSIPVSQIVKNKQTCLL